MGQQDNKSTMKETGKDHLDYERMKAQTESRGRSMMHIVMTHAHFDWRIDKLDW